MQRRLHGGGVSAVATSDRAYKKARQLRRNLSLPEKLLWVRLRGSDVRIRRQHPIGAYILDFYCPAAKLAIEIDGAAHDFGNRPQRDDTRTEWLKAQGIAVLRIPAKDVLRDADDVADAVLKVCVGPLHHPAAPDGPPPQPLARE